MIFSPFSHIPAGKPAADRRSLSIDGAAVINKKLAAVFNFQVVTAVKQELQPDRAKIFQRGVLSGSKFNRREATAAGRVTIPAVLLPVNKVL
jgi:hypothetical protein